LDGRGFHSSWFSRSRATPLIRALIRFYTLEDERIDTHLVALGKIHRLNRNTLKKMKLHFAQATLRLVRGSRQCRCSRSESPEDSGRRESAHSLHAHWNGEFTTASRRAESIHFDCRKWAVMATLAFQMTAGGAEPIVQWATVAGGRGDDSPYGLTLAPGGQLYLVGDFDQVLAADGYLRPTKVLFKFDLSGSLIGSQASRGEAIRGVAVDSQGNHYLTGQVSDSKRLGVGLTNDFYLAKYSSTGSLLWERTGGTRTYSRIYPFHLGGLGIALDSAGNIYVAGGSTGPAVFGNVTFPAAPGGPLLCKYDQNGTLLWAKRVEGAPDTVLGMGGSAAGIALDPDGNIVITGYLNNGQANFGGTVVSIAGPYSGYSFTAKYGPAGEVLWAKQTHGGGGVAVDRQGNIYCAGSAISADSTELNGMYCGKFSPAGDLDWDKIIPGAGGSSAALDGRDEPVFTASLRGPAQLDDILAQYNGIQNYPEILVCKADATGKFQWALTGSGPTLGWANQVVCDRVGNSYVAGFIGCGVVNGAWFCGQGMLGSFPLNSLFPEETNYVHDAFLARLTDADAAVPELKIARTASGLTLSWPASFTSFILEGTDTLSSPVWVAVPTAPVPEGDQNVTTIEMGIGSMYFRLRKP
jgi:hypothetical protein